MEALDWQPGQSMMPMVISTPHNDVRKLLRQAKYPQALLLVNKGLVNNPRDPQMRFWQGFIFEQLGQSDMGQQVYLGLTQDYPELAEPHNNLAALLVRENRLDEALAALQAAIRARPDYALALENLGDLHLALAAQAYARARLVTPAQTRLQSKQLATEQVMRTP